MSNEIILRKTVSVDAVKQYIASSRENNSRHQANILVHANGKDCCASVRFISAAETQGAAKVIIEDFHSIYADRSNDVFTTQESEFSFDGRSKALHIKTQGMSGIHISITITKI